MECLLGNRRHPSIVFAEPGVLHELFYGDSSFWIDLKKLRYEFCAFRRDPLGHRVTTRFDLPVQIGDVVVVEGQITAQQRVQQHAYNDRKCGDVFRIDLMLLGTSLHRD